MNEVVLKYDMPAGAPFNCRCETVPQTLVESRAAWAEKIVRPKVQQLMDEGVIPQAEFTVNGEASIHDAAVIEWGTLGTPNVDPRALPKPIELDELCLRLGVPKRIFEGKPDHDLKSAEDAVLFEDALAASWRRYANAAIPEKDWITLDTEEVKKRIGEGIIARHQAEGVEVELLPSRRVNEVVERVQVGVATKMVCPPISISGQCRFPVKNAAGNLIGVIVRHDDGREEYLDRDPTSPTYGFTTQVPAELNGPTTEVKQESWRDRPPML